MGMGIYYKYDINNDIKYNSNDFNILNYDNIVYLECFRNKLITLPILPTNLKILDCANNKLNHMSILSNCLYKLYCYNNKLNYLPKINKNIINCYYKINYDKYITNIINYDNIIKYINEYNLNNIQIKIYYYIKF